MDSGSMRSDSTVVVEPPMASSRVLPQNISASQLFATFVALVIIKKWVDSYRYSVKVPGVGYWPVPILSSWAAAIRFMLRPVEMVKEGVAKYNGGYFRISTLQGEYVLVSDRDKVAEYIRAPDSVLSAQEGANDQQQIPFTMGYGVGYRTYHVSVVRNHLTQRLPSHIDNMMDEISLSFDDLIGKPTDYQPFSLYSIIAMTVARTSNRVYVGIPLCRNEEFLKNAIDYAQAVVLSAEMIRMLPDWLKTLVVKVAPIAAYRRRALGFLSQMAQDRLDGKLDENGDKPSDLLQWLLDAAPPVEKTVPQLVERVMALNVASIHTTTMTFTGALYNLAAEPDKYIPALRAEILEHCEDGKVTKEALNKLVKMDSFLRESGRFNNAGLMSMQRNAKKKFTFSDGTVIPAGAKIGSPALILHRDPTSYENGSEFDGFRFSRPNENGEGTGPPRSSVTTQPEYQLFGHGRHACTGRFFATTEMKLMFINLLLRYDLKLIPGTAPQPIFVATMALPDTKLKVLLKERD